MIRSATPADAIPICNIYNYYVLHTHHNFEEEAVTVAEMEERIRVVLEKHVWLVYEEAGEIRGYAYAGPWKTRCSYRHSVETTVYVSNDHKGKGIGTKLYETLFKALSTMDVHAVMGGVALPNEGSVSLHEKFGFEKVAHFREVGLKHGRWIDVTYWERIMKKGETKDSP